MLSMSHGTSPTNYITSPSHKQESKEAAHNRFKYGSPKIRDLLRQKCRIRMKEQRNNNFLRKRNLCDEERIMFRGLLREGIVEIETDLQLQELIYEEMLVELDDWITEDFNYLIELNDLEEVICPMCQKRAVEQRENVIMCLCGFQTTEFSEISKFGDHIKLKVLEHEIKCSEQLSFFSEPKGSHSSLINAVCMTCDYWTTI